MTEESCLTRLVFACQAITQLYDVAMYGQQHREVQQLKILEKFGSGAVSEVARKSLRKAIAEVSAMEEAADQPTIQIDLSRKQAGFLRKALRQQLRAIRAIPGLARQQAVIALSASFEGFVADVISEVFDANPLVLKSGKSTLKDGDLVDAIQKGDPLSVLKSYRLRDTMYGSVNDWFSYLRKPLGLSIADSDLLTEMFLVRNAIIHNNARVSAELTASGRSRFKVKNRALNVTDRDLKNYTKAARECGRLIWSEYQQKFSTV